MGAELKKSCCRSTPRCRNCPVVVARARRRAGAPPARPVALFDEIYGLQPAALPVSVTQALAGLARAQGSRGERFRNRVAAWSSPS